jgi:hypothetical protein
VKEFGIYFKKFRQKMTKLWRKYGMIRRREKKTERERKKVQRVF